MTKHKKKTEGTFNPAPLQGEHRVTQDGQHVFIGNAKFKRTVLPKASDLHRRAAQAIEDLDI